MNPTVLRSLFLLLVLAASLSAASPGSDVWRAREMLSPETWSGVIEITNEEPHPLYPKQTQALIFEFNRVLWFYTPYDGTQSLSLSYGTSERDRQNLLPLLREIWPGFTHYHEVVAKPKEARKVDAPPANVCFIAAIAALSNKAVPLARVRNAALLCFYLKDRKAGHTVLTYETDEGHFLFDTTERPSPIPIDHSMADDPMRLARYAYPSAAIASARFLKLDNEFLFSRQPSTQGLLLADLRPRS